MFSEAEEESRDTVKSKVVVAQFRFVQIRHQIRRRCAVLLVKRRRPLVQPERRQPRKLGG